MRLFAALFALGFLSCLTARAADSDAEAYEERYIARVAERATWDERTNRARWMRELKSVYPGYVTNATTEDDYMTWFDLLAGNGDEWKRSSVRNERIGELYNQVADRNRLGPVPAVKREEFRRFVQRVFLRERPPRSYRNIELYANSYAERVFRVLDVNGDNELTRGELTRNLQDAKIPGDADANGRITLDEYRESFRRMSAARTALYRDNNGQPPKPPADTPPAPPIDDPKLPEWFFALDADEDAQISLFEWRQDNRPIAEFQEMDLDGDGLLLEDEYWRFIEKKEIELDQKRREEEARER